MNALTLRRVFGKTTIRVLVVAGLRMSAGVLVLLGLAASHVHAQVLTTLGSFGGGSGVSSPVGGLTLSGNTLYGAAHGGGYGDGMVFSLPLSGGSPTVVATFNGSNGANPVGGLTLSGNMLYGRTNSGGFSNDGTVFSVPVSGGSLTVLATLNDSNGEGGGYGVYGGGLTLIGNTLYGVGVAGGAYGEGAVFSLPLSGGNPAVLASFNGSNGQYPVGGVTVIGNTLYGTTNVGGAYDSGTVFSVPLSGGSPMVLATFNGSNGANPVGGLTLSGNMLYGVTQSGGAYGGGTVFSLPLSGGSPTVVATFSGSSGGYSPCGVTVIGNTLYGTTNQGGGGNYGTVFSVPLSGGSPMVLATFNGSNGANPVGGLTLSGNMLYGVTQNYGAAGFGTAFALNIVGFYAWNLAGGGSWATTGNWNPAGPPDGADNTTDFSQQTLAANATVTLDGSHTIGNLIFGDQGNAYNWTLAPGSGGTLAMQVSSGTPAVTVNNQTATISAVLAGNQGLTTLGGGTLILTASNVYTGGTTVVSGTLQLGDGVAKNGYIQGNILNDFALIFANPTTQTYSGSISGDGVVTKLGGGLLVFSGSSTYTGGTTVSAGTLQLGDGIANNGSVAGNITNNATLALRQSDGPDLRRRDQRERRRDQDRRRDRNA